MTAHAFAKEAKGVYGDVHRRTILKPKCEWPIMLKSESQTGSNISQRLGMNLQMAYLSNGAALLAPAVINWKVGHYAAVLKEENGPYLPQDPTFGNDAWVSRRALEAEVSGYFVSDESLRCLGWVCGYEFLQSVTTRAIFQAVFSLNRCCVQAGNHY